jgi:DNA-binding CsgD family transcriptional regulator
MTWSEICAEVIAAIGAPNFPQTAACAVCEGLGFELTAVLAHRQAGSAILFEDFGEAGFGEGLATYARLTHRMNPMLEHAPGAVRARDFAGRAIPAALAPYVTPAPDEELGFRTLGWPSRLEEIGLYIPACGGIVELGLYRPRGRRAAAAEVRALQDLARPLAAAFERHYRLCPPPFSDDRLSPREQEVCRLLLAGCGTEAIALRLSISAHTVKDHRKQIFRKLDVGSLQALFALERGQAGPPASEG